MIPFDVINANTDKVYFRDNRFFVRLLNDTGRTKSLPRANYNWMLGNPSFKEIPKGYVIHHLDNNETNDDVSNLVLMQKHHHAAYHWKQKIINTEVNIDSKIEVSCRRDDYSPIQEPTIMRDNIKDRYPLRIKEDPNSNKIIRLYNYKGRALKTREDAEWAKSILWPDNNKKVCPVCGGAGTVNA